MWESFANPRIPNTPGRAANQAGHLPNIERLAKAVSGTGGGWLATRCHRLSRAMLRAVLPYRKLHQLHQFRGLWPLANPRLRTSQRLNDHSHSYLLYQVASTPMSSRTLATACIATKENQ